MGTGTGGADNRVEEVLGPESRGGTTGVGRRPERGGVGASRRATVGTGDPTRVAPAVPTGNSSKPGQGGDALQEVPERERLPASSPGTCPGTPGPGLPSRGLGRGPGTEGRSGPWNAPGGTQSPEAPGARRNLDLNPHLEGQAGRATSPRGAPSPASDTLPALTRGRPVAEASHRRHRGPARVTNQKTLT